jgi:hypothetical protein
MSVNRERPHLLILPEDQANREIVNGFLTYSSVDFNRVQVMKNLGGWTNACNEFNHVYVHKLNKNKICHIMMLIDFDEEPNRRAYVEGLIPDGLQDRVFVIGVWSQPEKLKEDKMLTFEEIGRELEQDCPRQPAGIWNHELLKHNAVDLDRLWKTLGAILFPSRVDIRSAQEQSTRTAASVDSGDVGQGHQ